LGLFESGALRLDMVDRVCGELAIDTAAMKICRGSSRGSSEVWKGVEGSSTRREHDQLPVLEIVYKGIE
jgi:hypothetical protein